MSADLTRQLVNILSLCVYKNDKYLHHNVYRFVCIVCACLPIFFSVFSEVNSHVMKYSCSLLSGWVPCVVAVRLSSELKLTTERLSQELSELTAEKMQIQSSIESVVIDSYSSYSLLSVGFVLTARYLSVTVT